MTPERHQQIGKLYHLALELEPQHRAAFLERACSGDQQLRREVESLLASDEAGASFLAAPAMEVAARMLAQEQPAQIGRKFGHYQILSLLGSGGMGEVYLAQDTNLGRKVALKILPAEVASNQDRMRRFTQEAKAAAALNHPNIAHIYEIGVSNGVHFIAMEFVEGVTLSEKIHREKSELGKLLRYLQHAAEGLAKAHSVGIVHRDLKPDNIMITRDGHAKILDFGLAKLVELQQTPGTSSENASKVATAILPPQSSPGVVMGTVGYMSPEQAQGKTTEIDHRSDIFSFGCILFEAVTKHRAFDGESAIKSLHKVVYEPAPPIKNFNPSAPSDLQRIVRRSLAKDPDERYQTIRDVAIELKELRRELESSAQVDFAVSDSTSAATASLPSGEPTLAGKLSTETARALTTGPASSAEYIVSGIRHHRLATALAVVVLAMGAIGLGLYLHARNAEVALESINSIAVLPFSNQTADADSEYLSDGITESLINSLTQLQGLRVIPRTTVFHYKGREVDAQTIGRDLKVRAVLVGRVLLRGDTLSIQTELIDVENESQLWGEQYNRKLSDLLAIQEDIAKEISGKLRLKLSGEQQKQLAKRYTENIEAYQLYLKGRYYSTKYTPEGFNKGTEYFNKAIVIDPNYALAYDGLAYCYYATNWNQNPKEAGAKGRVLARKALEIDPTLAEAHTSLGLIHTWYDYDWVAAEREFKRALELNPNYPAAHLWHGFLLTTLGRADESIAEAKRAIELDPLSDEANATLGVYFFYARRYDEAMQQLRKTLELDPHNWFAHLYLARTYEQKGDLPAAITELKKTQLMEGAAWEVWSALGHAYAISGKKVEAQKIIIELKENKQKRSWVWPYNIATIYAGLGEKDQAFACLDKEYKEGAYYLGYLKSDPELDGLRGDPRFAELLRRVNLAP